jgi:hypothetical protein
MTLASAVASFTVDRRGFHVPLWLIFIGIAALALIAITIWWISRAPRRPDGGSFRRADLEPSQPKHPQPALVEVRVGPTRAPRGSQPWRVTLRPTRPNQATSAEGYFTDEFGTGS